MRVSATLIDLIQNELQTDGAYYDVTSRLLRIEKSPCTAAIVAKQDGVFCGEAVISAFQTLFVHSIQIHCLVGDGRLIKRGDNLVRLHSSIELVLSLERTLLNLLCHASGVATLTRKYVEAVSGYSTKILATRKTLPGLRELQLMAVEAGGGQVHRRSLSDGILIKENHQAVEEPVELLRKAREKRAPLHGIEIEIQDLPTLKKILSELPDVVMLDNLGLDEIRHALALIEKRCRVEVSGGIEITDVRAIAELGVDYISVGKLTHSATALDLSLDIDNAPPRN